MRPGDIVKHKLTQQEYIYLGSIRQPDERKFGLTIIVRDKDCEERSFYSFEFEEKEG